MSDALEIIKQIGVCKYIAGITLTSAVIIALLRYGLPMVKSLEKGMGVTL